MMSNIINFSGGCSPNQFSSSGSRQRWDPAKDAYTVARNLLLAHAEAYHAYRNKFEEHQKGYIGIALNALWCEPYQNDDAKDIEASKRAMDFVLGWFLEPVLTGKYPKRMRDSVPSENLAPISEREADAQGPLIFLASILHSHLQPIIPIPEQTSKKATLEISTSN
ncbi:UNVERIFIED_CONTAM: Raucaffricine-O-beta-D-glucosidase [Sesamum radiatum]|uniref:Raucaffricine-O-beta-D-glucosidase n=1 Tax=Sesamum radiatum TaxID=300843 RepID=A0AAW2MK56_SESRA